MYTKFQIQQIYKYYCQDIGVKYKEKDFEEFLEFLDIDFYDWVKENLKVFFRDHWRGGC